MYYEASIRCGEWIPEVVEDSVRKIIGRCRISRGIWCSYIEFSMETEDDIEDKLYEILCTLSKEGINAKDGSKVFFSGKTYEDHGAYVYNARRDEWEIRNAEEMAISSASTEDLLEELRRRGEEEKTLGAA